jgi:hypothetical protein
MKTTVLFLILIIPLFIKAQHKYRKPPRDSTEYYERQLIKMQRYVIDSVHKTPEFRETVSNIQKLHRSSSNYGAFVLFADIIHSDFTAFNKSIVQSGFSPMKPFSTRLGMGFSGKAKRLIFDIYFGALGFNNKSTRGDEKILISLSTVSQFGFGYDILNNRNISIYPYAGISFIRSSQIIFSKPSQTNSSFTNITNIVANNQSVTAFSDRLGYQAGLGIDLNLGYDESKTAKTILFFKAGTDRPVGNDKYAIENITYTPGIKQGDYFLSVGFKFAGMK